MDKTISISLGGYSFIIDEPAYLKLKKYLDDIRRSLKGMEGTDDVISDVEIRIAELFKEKLGNREVVSEPEVDQIIGIMGKPEQYVDDEDAETGSERKSGFTSGAATAGKKKLYRDPDDKVLGGVLSGIAHYIGIESWSTRV
ncbi:MAG: PspC domain-containing protein, partial [Moheibacter sp.]